MSTSLILGVVGGVVGGALGAVGTYGFGTAAGAQAGFAIGSAVGGGYDYYNRDIPPDRLIEAPRAQDLVVQLSTYGTPIPKLWGTNRIAGNIIWFSGIRKHVTETSENVGGGKGGGGSTITTQSARFDVDLAIAICDGPISAVRRIFADGRLILNLSADATVETISASALGAATLTFYTGSETQLPDPVMEAALGVGNVPAHRGLSYMVVTGFDLTEYGNGSHIPQFSFEAVETLGPGAGLTQTVTAIPLNFNGVTETSCARNAAGVIVFTQGNTLTFYDATSNTAIGSVNLDLYSFGAYGQSSVGLHHIIAGNDGDFWCLGVHASASSIIRVSPLGAVLNMIRVAGTLSGDAAMSHSGMTANGLYLYRTTAGVQFLDANPWMKEALAIDAGFGTTYGSLLEAGTVHSVAADSAGRVWWVRTSASIPTALAYWDTSVSDVKFVTLTIESPARFEKLIRGDNAGNMCAIYGLSGTRTLHRFNSTPALIETQSLSGTTQSGGLFENSWIFTPQDTLLIATPTGAIFQSFSTLTGTELAVSTGHGHSNKFQIAGYGGAVYHASYNASSVVSVVDAKPRVNLPTADVDKVKMKRVVEDLCYEAGLTAAEVDATALAALPIDGFTKTRLGSARSNIEPLQVFGLFDVIETEGKLKFVVRGGASSISIPHDDLVISENSEEDPLNIQFIQEAELPKKITVRFPDMEWDYQLNAASDTRIVTTSKEERVIDSPLVMTPTRGAEMASVILYATHGQRARAAFSTTMRYSKYDPGDVATIHDRNGNAFNAMLINRREDGSVIQWDALIDDAVAYQPVAAGSSTQSGQSAISSVGFTIMSLYDAPIIRDSDSDPSLYGILGSASVTWPGSQVLKSTDNLNFADVGSTTSAGIFGAATTTLGNFLGGNVFDELNSVEVLLTSGTLSSRTRAEVLGGANTAILGSTGERLEVFRFREASLIATNKYRLTGLLRGLFGTEQYITGHTSTDRFALLSENAMRPAMSTSDIGNLRYLKAVTLGQLASSGISQAVTNRAVGLKPLPVVKIRGFRNAGSDIDIKWVRRGRIDAGWREGVEIALGETAELYEVEIWTAGYASLKRTITGIVTPTTIYTSAQQVTDFGSNQASVAIRIYQISSVVGRGVVAAKTV